MRTRTIAVAFGLAASIVLAGCGGPQKAEKPEPPKLATWEEFEPAPGRAVWLGAQPSEQALDEFAARGGATVINLRTDEEMAFLPYYDRAVTTRGLSYIRIPTSGSTLGPSTQQALDDALAGADGPVMLHCASGGRATYVWAMERIANEGLSAEQAIEWATERRGGKEWEAGAKALREVEVSAAAGD